MREKDFDIANFLNVLEPYYKGGEYDYLLNSDKQLDLLDKRFIVFELDNISSNRTLLPVVTLIIMETFISKMRRLKGIRKMILIEECWKALTSANMSAYISICTRPCANISARRCGDAGGGRHHLVAHRQGVDHQQRRLQNPFGPA